MTFDFSLLELRSEIDFTKYPNIRPICLPLDDSDDFNGVTATVSGWGKTSPTSGASPYLMEVNVTVIDNDSCRKQDRNASSKLQDINDEMICTRSPPTHAKGANKGDSGGPLITVREGPVQSFQLIGVVSKGRVDTLTHIKKYPGMYGR